MGNIYEQTTFIPETIPEVNRRWGGQGCRVIGCKANLSKEKFTNKKYRLCRVHKACEELLLNGTPCRFCSQCSSLRPVLNFEGAKRGCKACSPTKDKKRSRKIGEEGRGDLPFDVSFLHNVVNTETAGPSAESFGQKERVQNPVFENTEALLAKIRRFSAEQELTWVTIKLIEMQRDLSKQE
jgi:hypothetical protein